jgi:WD40 repeat protein
VQALNTVEEAQPALAAYEVPQGLEIITVDNLDSLAELEQFTYEEPSLSQALRFEDGELLVVENEDWRSPPTAVSPDGATLIRVEERPSYAAIVRICDVSTGEQVRSFTSDETTGAVAFTPDGERFILNEGRGTIVVRDVTKRRPIAVWDVREGEQWKATNHLAVSPNGELAVFSVPEDDSLRVWDIAENDEVAVLEGHSDAVIALSFNAEGSLLASYGLDGVVRVWGVR